MLNLLSADLCVFIKPEGDERRKLKCGGAGGWPKAENNRLKKSGELFTRELRNYNLNDRYEVSFL